jgi:hypothetical protein
MAKVIKAGPAYDPMGGSNIVSTLLQQSIEEPYRLRMMRERAGLAEQMDIRKGARETTQAFEQNAAQESVKAARNTWWSLSDNERTPEALNAQVEAVLPTLSQNVIDTRFGGNEAVRDRLRVVLGRTLRPKEYTELLATGSRPSVEVGTKEAILARKRGRTKQDVAHKMLMDAEAFREGVATIHEYVKNNPNATSAQINRKFLLLSIKHKQSAEARKSLTLDNAIQVADAGTARQRNRVIKSYEDKNVDLHERVTKSVRALRADPTGLAASNSALQTLRVQIERIVGGQLAVNSLYKKAGIKQKSPIEVPAIASKMIVLLDEQGKPDFKRIFYNATLGPKSEKRRQADLFKKFVKDKPHTTLYKYLTDGAKALESGMPAAATVPASESAAASTEVTVGPDNQQLKLAQAARDAEQEARIARERQAQLDQATAAQTTLGTVAVAPPPGGEPTVATQILSAGPGGQPGPPSRAVSELLFSAPGLSNLDKAGNDAATAEQLRIALTGIGVDFSTIRDTYELIERFKSLIGTVVPEGKNIKNFGRLLTLVSRHKDAILSGVTR